MRVTFAAFARSSAAAAALVMGASLGTLATVTPASAKDAPKPTNSEQFSKVASPFLKLFNDVAGKKGKVPDDAFKTAASALVPELVKVEAGVKNPLDRLIFGDWQRQVGGWADNAALTNTGLQNMLDSGQLQPNQVNTVRAILGQTAFGANDYATVIKVLSPIAADPTADIAVPQWLGEAYAATGQPKLGLETLKAAIAARTTTAAPAPEELYGRASRIADGAKMYGESAEWSLLLVQAYPSPLKWLGAAQRARLTTDNFSSQEELDISRLLDQTGALKLAAKDVSREYVVYLQSIDPRRYPGEALRIAEQGIANGSLKADDAFVKDALTQAKARVAGDKASLPSLVKDANAAPTGKIALAAADAFLADGEAAQAATLYTLALTKGGVDADKDRLYTRLAIAQIALGAYADAKANLAKVTGSTALIARLWSVFADQKAAGK